MGSGRQGGIKQGGVEEEGTERGGKSDLSESKNRGICHGRATMPYRGDERGKKFMYASDWRAQLTLGGSGGKKSLR